MQIENWCVIQSMDEDITYLSPEMRSRYIAGNVYGHPTHEDGKYIRTSKVVWANDKEVTTVSGSKYLLGEPAPEYLVWCNSNGYKTEI